MDTQEVSRKRQKVDAAATEGIQVDLNDKPIVHDKEYYREDGDCIILVDRVLFKIHRFLLERDASAFSNMFSMPQGNARCQGNTDEDPLVLFDNVEDFRALCWIMYALPETYLQQHQFYTANLPKLVSLYLVAQKYHFESHHKFARELLQRHCAIIAEDPGSDGNHGYHFRNCAQSHLESLLRIASLEDKASTKSSFLDSLQKIWANRLRGTKEPTSFAFEVGETLGLRTLLSGLYHLHLQRMRPVRIEDSNAYTLVHDDLAPHRKLALYHGYCSLRHYWPQARETALKEGMVCSNVSGHACQRIWKQSWKIAQDRVNHSLTFDPVFELAVARAEIFEEEELEGNYVPCAQAAIEKMLDELLGSLADHFIGPPPT